ncbi:MAG: hydroxymethylglutaryl-CoA lyase [Desulfosalsimonas sp.]
MEVTIREVALRDGLQSEKEFVATKDKLALADALARAGVTFMETTSFVSPAAVPQLRDAAELMAEVPHGNLLHEVMVPNPKGARSALDAGVDRLIVFLSASEAHNRENVGRSISESLDAIDRVFELAAGYGAPVAAAIATAFGCPYQGRVPETDVVEMAERLAAKGADRITLADTTGMANPAQIKDMTALVQNRLPETFLCLHLHNNRGIAMANLYAGYLAGIRMFDTSLGGIGGCPNVPQAAGNLATEDVVWMFESMGISTGMDLSALIDASLMLEKILGHPLPGQVMKSGPAARVI